MIGLQLAHNDNSPLKILCLGSHSDDIEIGCGGAILRLLCQHKCDVTWIVLGSSTEREQEARNSSMLFLRKANKADVTVKAFRDGFFPYDGAQIKEFFETLKSVSPDLIFTHTRKDAHQDHRVVAELTWNTFRNHLILEYEILKYDGDLGQPNVFMPLDEAVYQTKVSYLMEVFETQRGKRWFQRETFFGLMRLRGMECNAPSGYAEAFYSRKLVI